MLTALRARGVDPRGPTTKKLVGAEDGWRLRAGDYRVLYEIYDDRVVVLVMRIAHRHEAYRREAYKSR